MDTPTSTKFPLLYELRDVLAQNVPFCSGTFKLPPQAFELYYGKTNAKYLDFTQSADNQALAELADACEPAKFGKGTETVLDETYRKSWKMDSDNFKTGLDVETCGLVDTVQTGLLPDYKRRTIMAELYKLNVYGEGAFFKPHKDTPRRQDMFGSLVVVMPTAHQGGQLVLRHQGKEWTFDAAKLLSGEASNTLAYIAFFSDVEHEVLPVTSGHRVTLTYNLFYTWDTTTRLHRGGVSPMWPAHADVSNLRRLLGGLLDNPEFLPEGGTLGFGLLHGYPFPKVWENRDDDPLDLLKRWLKGSDRSLFEACQGLGLQPLLRLIHYGDVYDVLLRYMVELEDLDEQEQDADRLLVERYGGVVVLKKEFEVPDTGDQSKTRSSKPKEDCSSESEDSEVESDESEVEQIEIHWVTDTARSDCVRSARVWYGNEPSLDHIYAYVCLIVKVAAAPGRIQRSKSAGAEANKEGSVSSARN